MAHVKISQMPALAGALDNDDVFPLVRGNANYRVTFNQLRATIDSSGGGAVSSVNGKTGDVVLTADDVGALPASTTYVASVAAGANVTIDDTDPSAPIVSADVGVTSVQGHTGAVVLGLKEVTDVYMSAGTPFPVQALAVYKDADLLGKIPQTALDDDGNFVFIGGLDIAVYSTTGTPTVNTIPAHGTSGRLRVGTPSAGTDATTKTYVDNLINTRLTAAQRTAINALTSGSSAADIVAALQAT